MIYIPLSLERAKPLQAAIHIVTMTVGGMESKVTDNKVVILTAASPANKSKERRYPSIKKVGQN